MTSHSDSANPAPTEEPRANWNWLADRIQSSPREEFECWLEDQLDELERSFADLVTPKSRTRAIRSQR